MEQEGASTPPEAPSEHWAGGFRIRGLGFKARDWVSGRLGLGDSEDARAAFKRGTLAHLGLAPRLRRKHAVGS